jgi:SAM-dependent methyltransferase
MNDPAAYGDAIATLYDQEFAPPALSPENLALLVRLAENRTVLDIGAGTGRVAVALARAGCTVTAVDVSQRMTDVLNTKIDGLDVEVVCADATKVSPPGQHLLAVCLFNTLFMVGDREAQRALLANAAGALHPDGRLLVEGFMPDPGRFGGDGSASRVRAVTADRVIVQFSLHDAAAQRITGQDVVFDKTGITLLPATLHYLWPEQLDELARSVGMRLERRWADWCWDSPVDSHTRNVLSLYRKANDDGE